AVILPLHALTQLASNLSRAAFGWRHIDWRLVPSVVAGGVLGAALGAGIYARLALDWLPAVIGVLILLLTWVPLPRPRGRGQVALAVLGCYQTGLGMVAGATGPLGAAVLARYHSRRDWLVVNTAVYMSVSHILRASAFGLLGFSVGPWWPLLLGMVATSIAGSWVGTRLRGYLPQADFQRWFRLLVTLLALRMIVMAVLG
ncbi:MAG: sulfite exporter TauE/SafE family protein, partial [Parahaliea sp.]